MAITAAQVKELRQRTGCGMMECKKALTETDGNMDTAAEALRKSGLAKADKKAGRVAAEGIIKIEVSGDGKSAAIVEVNSETDFVAKKEEFQDFARAVALRVLNDAPADLEALMALPLQDGGEDVEQVRRGLIATIGENITVRRFIRRKVVAGGGVASYLHGDRIGVLVELDGGDAALARDVAMHIAASKPVCVDEDGVAQEILDKEKEIFSAQAAASGKPADIIEKMVSGRIRKFLGEITLLGQPFVKDPDQTVGKLLKAASANVGGFDRLELGEGIEKKTENFAEEVMAQVQGS
ncbi:Translation elongation factor Ts [hydrothermal vent metagenome]|uniref:Translation elongation factor Ts n=1 Tax=hydrothermal vent metagenome TaxID=652676 RepID=A0A3B0YJ76_9ZZZZ